MKRVNFIKILVILFIISVVLSIGYGFYFLMTLKNTFNPTPISEEEISNILTLNVERFQNVVVSLDSIEGNIRIQKNDLEKSIKSERSIRDRIEAFEIKDNNLNQNITFIFNKLLFESIIEEDNQIEFVRQSGLDWRISVVYLKKELNPKNRQGQR
ncbi:hypothetical protein [Tepidibacillus marianensis]|uniref:hypothetical protein n=1 Tax=Tepidibacillus marianensis TaxID=3131995 RepID=UPI0030CC6F64